MPTVELISITPNHMELLKKACSQPYGKDVSNIGVGNIIKSGHLSVLELMCNDWQAIAKDYDRARKQTLRCYEIGTKFRPYKRVLKMLQEHMGRKNDMMPICPHCREKIDLEKLANGVWIRKEEK